MEKYKVGDRVRYDFSRDGVSPISTIEIGTIKSISNDEGYEYGIEFDNDIEGHTLYSTCEDGHGWYCKEENILSNKCNYKFKIGDKVIYDKIPNKVARVKGYHEIGEAYAIEYDSVVENGHDCFGMCEDGHGLYAVEDYLTRSNSTDEASSQNEHYLGEIEPYDFKLQSGDFKKENLRSGDVVILRKTYIGRVCGDALLCYYNDITSTETYMSLDDYDDDLTLKDDNILSKEERSKYDIMKVLRYKGHVYSRYIYLDYATNDDIFVMFDRGKDTTPNTKNVKEWDVWDNGMTLEENHRALWNWLADHPDEEKSNYFNYSYITSPENDCFACEYARLTSDGVHSNCDSCPINGLMDGCVDGSLYDKWYHARGYEKATIAHKIATAEWIDYNKAY